MIGNIESGKERGEMVHIRGLQLREEGLFIKPTILTHRHQGVKFAQE